MACASCGKQIAAGVRYCIHCGAEQAVPTPIAAVAAALMARAGEREAANAAHAESVAGMTAHSNPRRSDDAASSRRGIVAANAEPARPVYARRPGRGSLAVALIAGCALVALAVAAAFTWRLEQAPTATSIFETVGQKVRASAATPALPTAEPSPATGTTTAATAEPSAAREAAPSSPGARVALPASGDTASGAQPPVEIKPLPPRPNASRSAHAGAAAKPPNAPALPATQAESAPAPAVAAPAPVAPKVAAAAPGASHVADRWQRLDADLSRCTREDFITRVICAQRARFRYCDGYWGKVAASPGSPQPERGQ
jgi:hypothetical protein